MDSIELAISRGFHLTPEYVNEYLGNKPEAESSSATAAASKGAAKATSSLPIDLYNELLNTDIRLKSLVKPYFTNVENTAAIQRKDPVLVGKSILQIASVSNITNPTKRRSDDSNPRVLSIQLTDGHTKMAGVELARLPDFNANMPPGGKVLYSGGRVVHGKLLLSPDNLKFIGGNVAQLVEAWTANNNALRLRALGLQVNRNVEGPPKFELKLPKKDKPAVKETERDKPSSAASSNNTGNAGNASNSTGIGGRGSNSAKDARANHPKDRPKDRAKDGSKDVKQKEDSNSKPNERKASSNKSNAPVDEIINKANELSRGKGNNVVPMVGVTVDSNTVEPQAKHGNNRRGGDRRESDAVQNSNGTNNSNNNSNNSNNGKNRSNGSNKESALKDVQEVPSEGSHKRGNFHANSNNGLSNIESVDKKTEDHTNRQKQKNNDKGSSGDSRRNGYSNGSSNSNSNNDSNSNINSNVSISDSNKNANKRENRNNNNSNSKPDNSSGKEINVALAPSPNGNKPAPASSNQVKSHRQGASNIETVFKTPQLPSDTNITPPAFNKRTNNRGFNDNNTGSGLVEVKTGGNKLGEDSGQRPINHVSKPLVNTGQASESPNASSLNASAAEYKPRGYSK